MEPEKILKWKKKCFCLKILNKFKFKQKVLKDVTGYPPQMYNSASSYGRFQVRSER